MTLIFPFGLIIGIKWEKLKDKIDLLKGFQWPLIVTFKQEYK